MAKNKNLWRVFEVVVEDGEEVFKDHIVEKSKKDIYDFYDKNSRILKCTEKTGIYFTEDSVKYLEETLLRNNWGKVETSIITHLLEDYIKVSKNEK